jgi:fucose permease
MTSKHATSRFLLLLVFVAFVSLGLPDAVQGVAWPVIRHDFGRSLGELSYLLMAGASGYFTSGAVGGVMMQRLGVGRVLGISTGLVTAGVITYALTPNLWVMIPAAFVIGIGSGAVDAGLNFYAADKFSVRTMSWLHAFFGVGAMLGPVIMSATLSAGTSWRWGYAIIASVTLILTVTFFANARRFDEDIEHEGSTGQRPPLSAGTVVRMPLVWLQIAIFFVLTALEVIPSVWTTTILIERFDVAQGQAGLWAGVYWGTQSVGRFVLPVLAKNVAPSRVIQIAPFGILAGSIMMLMDDSWIYRLGIMVIAFSNASIFPMLMSLTPSRLGRDAAIHAIGWQVSAATVGGALIPSIAGFVAQSSGVIVIPVFMVVMSVMLIFLEGAFRLRADHPDHRASLETASTR